MTIVRTIKGSMMAALCALAVAIFAVPAQAAPNDPLFLLRPISLFKRAKAPPPSSTFEGSCGLAVDGEGRVYVSDYYHDFIDVFGANINGNSDNGGNDPRYGYETQIADLDPYDGPCGLAMDAAGSLFVNEYHRSVFKIGTGVITGAPVDAERPTGVAVDQVSERLYVNDRDHVAVFDLAGAPLGEIGAGSLIDGYGLAVSRFPGTVGLPATAGRIYAADAASNTVKVFAPDLGGATPIATIDGSETPLGAFVSLEDAAVAVDNVTGEVYVVDNLQPDFTEKPEAVVYVFDASGAYEGRLKYSIVFPQTPGLAVDNSGTANQGRVYVTSGNSDSAAVYGYPPGAASDAASPLPEPKTLEPSEEEEISPPAAQGPVTDSVGSATAAVAPTAALAADTGSAAPAAKGGRKNLAKRKAAKNRRGKHRAGRIKKGN